MEEPRVYATLRELAKTRPKLREMLWKIPKEVLPNMKLSQVGGNYTLKFQVRQLVPSTEDKWEWVNKFYTFT